LNRCYEDLKILKKIISLNAEELKALNLLLNRIAKKISELKAKEEVMLKQFKGIREI
jgi:hypothetical protein